MKKNIRHSLVIATLQFLLASLSYGQTLVGTNAPGSGTNFVITLAPGVTNMSLVVSNSAASYSHLLLKNGSGVSDATYDYISGLNGLTNAINLETSELTGTNFELRVRTPATSTQHVFKVLVTTNRSDLRSGAYPVLKPLLFTTTGTLTNGPSGSWHYFQVDIPTNLPGWRIVLSSSSAETPDLYVRRGAIPSLGAYDKRSLNQTVDTVVFTDTEATNHTYFIGVNLPNTATNSSDYTLSTELGYLNTLAWDPGVTHEGTQIFTNASPTGGNYFFKILPQNTSVGAWRTALNVVSGEAHVYLRQGSFEANPATYTWKSERVGADGFVLHSSQFAAGQTWYLCVAASPGAQWNLVSGEAYVLNLGSLAPYDSTASSTNVPMGAEGMRFFRTTPTVGTIAWRLYLNGLASDILVKKTSVPHPYNSNYDLKQAGQMLVVPNYLVGGDQYLISVSNAPGTMINFDSRQQEIKNLAFIGSTNLVITNYGYVTFRVNVPVQQIAWLTAVTPSLGDANLSVRRDYVPNEWNNDAFSEVTGTTTDSISMVPPTLSDGTFFITVYGHANYSVTLSSGNPVITDVAFTSVTANDDPTRVGWRYYRVPDINSQLGSLGWDLFLQSQPAGTELAIRRNAVPGRWNYRPSNNSSVSSQGYVDYSGPQGFLQRPGHQADIWYIGVYNPTNALSNFQLKLQLLTGQTMAFDGAGALTNVVNQPPSKFHYYRIDVPVGVLGWDLRLTNITSGDPRLVVRRDQLPDTTSTHSLGGGYWNPPGDSQWRSGYQWGANDDWTDLSYTPTGGVDYGRIISCGMGNPLEPGTYYVGVLNNASDSSAMSYTLVSRGIGPGYSIPVNSLAFSNDLALVTLAPREVAYFQVTVPTNRESWKLRLTTNMGEAFLMLQQDVLPNVGAASSAPNSLYGGRMVQKPGNEEYLLLPSGTGTNIISGTYYLAVVGEGQNPVRTQGRIGTGNSTATLETFGTLIPTNLGTLTGPDLVASDSLAGGEIQTYQFTVPPGVLAMEVWLENHTGYPRMSMRADTLIPTPLDNYGNDGGSGYTWYDNDLINVANPAAGTYTLTLDAAYSGGVYSNAAYTIRVKRLSASPITFDGGTFTMGPGHLIGTWRYYSLTVPPGPFGWDLRLTNVISGDPRLVVRRDLAPDSLGTHNVNGGYWNPWGSASWPTGYQMGAAYDWTAYQYDVDGTNRYGHILAMGMGNPLEPGNFILGVFNGGANTNEMRYTIASRGIGSGFIIPVTPMGFTNGLAAITNLAPREAAYYSIVVPTNLPSWKLKLSTNVGEALLILQKDFLPNVAAGGSLPYALAGGRELHKAGDEQYTLLPASGQSNIVSGTYYLAVVSEGLNPTNSRLGSNTISASLQSFGVQPVINLGSVAAGSDIVQPDTLEGGTFKMYQFSVSPGTLSMEVHLEDRLAKPRMTLRTGDQVPNPIGTYGNDGGQSQMWYDDTLILMANPAVTNYSLVVYADGTGPGSGVTAGYSNAAYTVRVHAVGAIPLAFDGGVITVTDHAPESWRYYLVTNVPANALGWDVRLTNVISGDPRLVIRREILPDSLNTHGAASGNSWFPYSSTNWPTNYQWGLSYDWTGYSLDANGTNRYGHTLQMGMGNPLTAGGNYYIAVLNYSSTGYGTNIMCYTLTTRGIGSGFTIPVTPMDFASGSVTNSGLSVREASYYSVDVPTNTPSWKLRLAVGAGESLFLVQKDYLPNILGNATAAPLVGGGYEMQKVGNEHYVLLPQAGQTNIIAGRYYLLVASEGQFPISNRAGTNSSSYLLQSLGSLFVDDLGTLSQSGLARTNSVEGGEFKAYRFTIPTGLLGVELRLDNRVGNPFMSVKRGLGIPYPYSNYGYNYGDSREWDDARLITLANPAATNYTMVVQGSQLSSAFPDADYVLRVDPAPIKELAFDYTMVGCVTNFGEVRVCTNSSYCSLLADNERTFYRVQVPGALPDGTPVIGWRLAVSNNFGQATVRVRKDVLPSDSYSGSGQTSFIADQLIIVPQFLTPGTWYVEVKGTGSTDYCLTSSSVRLQRYPWDMPGLGETNTTPGLTNSPLFGDSGFNTNGIPLPGDGGTDLEQGFFHYYAINVPTNNGGLFRMVLEAISGNPDLYLRIAALPTLSHRFDGQSGSIYERSLVGSTTEYGNWVPNLGRYETVLSNGVWYVAIRATGLSNCRYRLRLSTGTVTNLALNAGATNQILAAGDWRYYQFTIPTNAPTAWNLTFQQHVGDVVMYLRDTIPPGQYTTITDYRDWADDNKNHAVYAFYDPPNTYTNRVPPLRPGHNYFVGFRAVSDATFTVFSATNGVTIGDLPTIAFYGGSVTNYLPPSASMRYRIEVPADATRWLSYAIHSNTVLWYLDQGSLPSGTSSDHARSGTSANVNLNQYLLTANSWPWSPSHTFYLTVTNTSALSQPFSWRMDGRNCTTDDNDIDGLPDCWELTYFPSIYSYTATADADNDGNNNLMEYLDGTDPTNPTSMLARLLLATNGAGGITVSPLQASYPWSTPVTLTATPLPGNVFIGWTISGGVSNVNPLILPMITNRTVTANFSVDYGPAGMTRADYRFQNNLVSSAGTPPDLTLINTGHYYTNQILDGIVSTVLRFPAGKGLQLQPSSTVFASNVYTLVILFKFDDVSVWRRILDVKGGTTDNGLYAYSGQVKAHPTATSASICLTNNTWHQLVISRDLLGQVVVYSDRLPVLNFNDSAAVMVINATNALRFFKDDGIEESAGYVARIRSYASVLTPAELTALDRLPGPLPPVVLSDPGFTGAGKFFFTISGPTGAVYRIQTDPTLTNWATLSTLTGFPSVLQFTNTNAPLNTQAQFFRVLFP